MSFLKFESVFSNSQYHSKRITFRKRKKNYLWKSKPTATSGTLIQSAKRCLQFKLHNLFRPSFGLIILVITKLRISLWCMNPRLLKYSHFEGEKIGFLKYFVSFTGRMRSYLKYNDSAFLEDLRFKKHKNNENIIPVEWQSSLQKVEILIHGRFKFKFSAIIISSALKQKLPKNYKNLKPNVTYGFVWCGKLWRGGLVMDWFLQSLLKCAFKRDKKTEGAPSSLVV